MTSWRTDLGQQWRAWHATTYRRDMARLVAAASTVAGVMLALALLGR